MNNKKVNDDDSSSASKTQTKWWQSLENQECPITLEELSTLPYPPFSLTSGKSVSYFDGLALASYIVSRGIFQNPLTRQELSMDDCRRLDDYLEQYCYKYQQGMRKVAVAESYALRASVQVEQRNGNGQGGDRAQALRNTATAALAGLFVYGNDRHSHWSRQEEQEDNINIPRVASLPREDQLILDWGFDLSRAFTDSAEYIGEGWTVIDDDEAIVVASQREAYQATQNAFPCLTNSPQPSSTSAHAHAIDHPHLVERVHELAIADQEEEARRARQLELSRQQMLQGALERRDERKKEQERIRADSAAHYIEQKKEEEEIQKARAEIEAWREEQWKKLRLLSETKQKRENQPKSQKMEALSKETKEPESSIEKEPTGPTEEEIAAQKKAKAADKRKRAKTRKKTQKVENQAQLEQKKKEEALAAKKAASAVQCAACGQGIVGNGFEKFDKKFCSPKCARTTAPNR